MEVHRDVFVSNVAIEDWQPDPELSGDAEAHVLFDTESMSAGLTRYSKDAGLPDPVAWTVPATEVLLVLEGEARIEIEDGPVLELKPGDMACLPKGAVTGWSPSPPASLDGSNPAHAGTPPDRAEGGEVDRRPVQDPAREP